MEQPDRTLTPRQSSLRNDNDARLPAAAYLRYESRADGWSAGRQAAFLSHLADHGVVADAARSVGMSQAGGYALRREARGYAFNLGWEAALIIARRVVADNLMAAAIKGEESRWVREDGVTTYIRQNTKLSLALLDRVNPATSLAEVVAVATRFDWFLQLVDEGVAAENLWELFFEDALARSEREARARVRAALLLCDDSAVFDDDDDAKGDDAGPVEYKSMDGPIRSCGSQTVMQNAASVASSLASSLVAFVGIDPRHHSRRRAQLDTCRLASFELETNFACLEVERDTAEVFQKVGTEQQRWLIGETEHAKGRYVRKGDGDIAHNDRTEPELADPGQFEFNGDTGDAGYLKLFDLYAAPADNLVAQRQIADGNLGPGIDHRVDCKTVCLGLRQDQLSASPPRGDHDFAVHARCGLVRILDSDQPLFEVHHQPLIGECVDTEHAVPAQIALLKHRQFEIGNTDRTQPQFVDQHARNTAAAGHAVYRHRRTGWQFQCCRNPPADHRTVSSAIDNEAVWSGAVDLDRDGHSARHLARVYILAADRQRIVDDRRRQRRHGCGRHTDGFGQIGRVL